RADVAEGLERIRLAGALHGYRTLVEIDRNHVAGLQDVTQAVQAFTGIQFAGGHGISEKDTGKTFSQNDPASGRAQRNRCVFTRAATTEIFSGNHDGKLRVKLAILDESRRVERVGQSAHRIAAELFVLVRNGRHQGQVLRGNDLVGVDVVAHH